jgi:uncharacterized damage-inducible protein DinB
MTETSLVILCRHNLWANLQVLDVCATLNAAQLATADPGAYGSIQATLAHLVSAEQYYAWYLRGRPAGWTEPNLDGLSVAEMRPLAEESGRQLCELARRDENLPLPLELGEDGKVWKLSSGYMLTQALTHATEHRTNITTTLSRMGMGAFDLSAWAFFAAEVGRP